MELTKLELTTTTYMYKEGFCVDIVRSDLEISVWLFHRDYGTKDLMFCVSPKEIPDEDVLMEIIMDALEDQIAGYEEEHMK